MLRYKHNFDDECHYSSCHSYNIDDFDYYYGDVNHVDVFYNYEFDWNFNLNYSHHDDDNIV